MKDTAKPRALKRDKPYFLTKDALLWVGAFAGIGIITLIITWAAASSPLIEPEGGSLLGGVTIVNDANASGGQAVKFGALSTTVILPNPGTFTNITGNMSGLPAQCGEFGGIWPVPNSAALIAGVSNNNLYKSNAGNNSWAELGIGAGSVKVNNSVGNIVFDPNNPNIFYEGGFHGEGVYKTTNGGVTFQRLGTIRDVDSISVDFSDPNRQTLIAGIHEGHQMVYKSSDGGNTWTNIYSNLGSIGGTGFTSQAHLINSTTYIVNSYPSWGGGSPGIFRTTNAGASWTKVSPEAANSPAVVAPDGTIYYTVGNGLIRSTDNGLTWAVVGNNSLHTEFRAYVLPDNRVVSANNNNKLVISSNAGSTWTEFGPTLPYTNGPPPIGGIAGVTYSPTNRAFYVWHWNCASNVPSDAVYRLM